MGFAVLQPDFEKFISLGPILDSFSSVFTKFVAANAHYSNKFSFTSSWCCIIRLELHMKVICRLNSFFGATPRLLLSLQLDLWKMRNRKVAAEHLVIIEYHHTALFFSISLFFSVVWESRDHVVHAFSPCTKSFSTFLCQFLISNRPEQGISDMKIPNLR